jgi:2-polyprenyl-3-methyl-5-hydroxy-6-metoxy-1,4-benzoquinol methylase
MDASAEGRRIDWEETACPLCGGTRRERVIDASDPLPGNLPPGENSAFHFRVVRCHDCGLSYTNPRPSPSSIGRFYPDDYAPYQLRDSGRKLQKWRPWSRRDAFASVLPLPPGGRLLDFGCGAGDMLREMNQRGWRVTGMDFSPRVVRFIREQLGLPAVEGTLPHPELQAGSFEAITMSQSLEHVHDPLRVLRAAYCLLAPGGKLAVAVPNIDSLPFRWFGADWYGLDVPRHLTHFTPSTLVRMLERAGFSVTAVRLIRHNSWLRRSVSLAQRHPDRHPVWRRLMHYRLAASLAGWYSLAQKQANCILAVGVRETRTGTRP